MNMCPSLRQGHFRIFQRLLFYQIVYRYIILKKYLFYGCMFSIKIHCFQPELFHIIIFFFSSFFSFKIKHMQAQEKSRNPRHARVSDMPARTYSPCVRFILRARSLHHRTQSIPPLRAINTKHESTVPNAWNRTAENNRFVDSQERERDDDKRGE